MAIITISREVAAFGDEVAEALAKELNYKFVKRTDIEKRIIELGFPRVKCLNTMKENLDFLHLLQKIGTNI